MKPLIPANLLALAEPWTKQRGAPLADPSVLGLFYGIRFRDGQWRPKERGLSLRVTDDRAVPDKARLLPVALPAVDVAAPKGLRRGIREFGTLLTSLVGDQLVQLTDRTDRKGFPPRPRLAVMPDIVPVENLTLHGASELSLRDALVWRPNDQREPRCGTITAISAFQNDNSGLPGTDIFALASGHVLNPDSSIGINTSYDSTPGSTGEVGHIYNHDEIAICDGSLQYGHFGNYTDLAVMKICSSDIPSIRYGGSIYPEHREEDGRIWAADRAPKINDLVRFYAPRSQEDRFGIISGISIGDVILCVHSPKNQFVRYLNVIEVLSQTNKSFSLPGDSGALVFDARGKALGTVLGGTGASAGRPASYLLLLSELAEHARETFDRFFTR